MLAAVVIQMMTTVLMVALGTMAVAQAAEVAALALVTHIVRPVLVQAAVVQVATMMLVVAGWELVVETLTAQLPLIMSTQTQLLLQTT